MGAFVASSFAQINTHKKIANFQIDYNKKIVEQKSFNTVRSVNSVLNESFNLFPPNNWSANPATGFWQGSATWQYAQYASNWGDGVFALMDCFNITAGGTGSLITPVLHPTSASHTLSYNVIEMLLSQSYIDGGMQLYVEFSTDGGTNWTSSSTNVLTSITNHNTATAPQTATTLTADLSAYNDQAVQVRFRCVSDFGGFSLFLDNVTGVEADVTSINNDLLVNQSYLLNSTSGYYGTIPSTQASPVAFTQKVSNIGVNNQTNVTLSAIVNDGSSDVYTATSTPVTVNAGDEDSLYTSTSFTIPTGSNSYRVAYNIVQTETDETPNNNKDTVEFASEDYIFARAYSPSTYFGATQLASLGSGDGLVVGNIFNFVANTRVESITMMIYTGTSEGAVLNGQLYDASNGTLIAETGDYSIVAADVTNMMVTLTFTNPVDISAGTAIVAGMEITYVAAGDVKILCDGSDLQEISYNLFYLPNATPNPGWTSINGTGTPVIILDLTDPTSVNQISKNNISVYPNPSNGLVTINGVEKASVNVYNTLGALVMSANNVNSIDMSALANGTYMVKVTTANESVVKQVVLTK